jgi:glycosyltransferase involved in cell wall biosynthesis
MESAIAEHAESMFDVVHQHGIWAGVSRATNAWRRRYHLPTVVGPMGSLEPWAMRRSRWKKKVALALYEAENLREADCLHACAADEYRSFREYGLKRPVAIIPNGVADDVLQNHGDAVDFRKRFGIAEGERLALFLARISPVKGLPLLIDALKQVESAFAGWRLVIAGADEFGHLAEVRAKIRDLDLAGSVLFTGPLYKKDKWDAFAAAELFVLPSTRDAGPLVIPEALGSGLPVLTTKGTPWKDLETFECGWWPDVDVDAVADALRRALSASPETLKAMGRRSRELVARKYTWSKVAELTIRLYDWLQGNGERPGFVEEN